MEARFACGSMVRFFLFLQKCCTMCNIFVKKAGFFRPARGDIPRQTWDRLIHVSIGCFARFAHVVVFVVQTPTA